ncbi:hypothetical protein [Mesorhizobium japonicum]|uniref:hypothetical protein n=1 Tax=Mesorhizobium japonicum TaxID=2066070 RepID=UPI00032368E5|nr:hypothetical protein [Mesorhizobium japonicum]
MATIGTFKKSGDHEFIGEIVTLSVKARGGAIVSETRTNCDDAQLSVDLSIVKLEPPIGAVGKH